MIRKVATTLSRPLPCRSLSLLHSPRPSLVPSYSPSRPIRSPGLHRSLTVHAQPPPPDLLDEYSDDLDPALANAVIILTDAAMAQIARAQQKAKDDSLALRVSVESGGCHGYQYKMEVTTERQPDDYLFNPSSENAQIKVLIDASSLPLLEGSTIDYATELIGSSFRITGNPHASDKGGCGCGVSWELKE